ncbi:hypothetical protein NE237_013558 [Protea cynaroides]|uniref:PTC1-like winged helix-turn-helix domain-containing protein n=1 Tax=Protea cynaroides TaxID=273540 RepID=A0A9Q0H066_9MAGN|nr:hypothetical protein NE237_013558 [Protea cynaroides]
MDRPSFSVIQRRELRSFDLLRLKVSDNTTLSFPFFNSNPKLAIPSEAFPSATFTDHGCLTHGYHLTQNPSMVGDVRTMDGNPACNEPEISEQLEPEVGYFYEIDHRKLPPRSPIQLKSIRIVMVNEKTEHNVSVKFPSTLSLRKYFNNDSSNGSSEDPVRKVQPVLDEQFVMGSRLARIVLTKLVPTSDLLKHKHLHSFWMVPLETTESFSCVASEGLVNDSMVKGTCWSALKSAGQMHWGVRRRVTFIGRHKEKIPRPFFASVGEEIEGERVEEEEEGEEEHEEDPMETKIEEKKETTRKRKPDSSSRIQKATSVRKCEREKLNGCNSKREKTLNKSKDRWSADRYNLAEHKLLEIMKERGAVFGHPMLRPALRQEARKHIGDTGLLDHLLKHMAGKVAPGGIERFRRRHNPEGAMEYWLESAELVNVRKEAGVNDPYWFPPPGWMPGDNPSQHPVCSSELNLLKEEMAVLKREVQELLSKKQLNKAEATTDDAIVNEEETNATSRSLVDNPQFANTTHRQEIYEKLVCRKAELEKQLVEFSNLLNEMQEEFGGKLSSGSMDEEESGGRSEKEKGEGAKRLEAGGDVEKGEEDKEEEKGKAAEAGKAEKRQRLRSGFRICKPQGTFLWPNMVGSGGSNILSPSFGGGGGGGGQGPHNSQVEDLLLMVPTPSSVSSSTSAPRLIPFSNVAPPPPPAAALPLITPTTPTSIISFSSNMNHPQPRTSSTPLKPIAEKKAFTVKVSSSAVVIPESTTCPCQGDNINISTTIATVLPPGRLNLLDLNDVVSCTAAVENEECVVQSDHDVAVVSSASTTMTREADDHDHLIQHYHRHQQESCSSSVGTNFWQSKQFKKLSSISDNIPIDVIRSGRRSQISIFDILVGDIVCLKIGDQIPAAGPVTAIAGTFSDPIYEQLPLSAPFIVDALFESENLSPNVLSNGADPPHPSSMPVLNLTPNLLSSGATMPMLSDIIHRDTDTEKGGRESG